MALPARRIPESVAHLDIEIIAAALVRNDANIGNAARALGVPSGDLRKLVLIDQRLADSALEAVELRLDDCEANLHEALRGEDPRRRDAASMFFLRNSLRAARRGYAVSASAASLEAHVGHAPPQTIVVRWAGDDREMDVIERDGKKISVPRYGDGRGDDCVEGEVATPAVLIDHASAAAEPVVVQSEPGPAPEPVEPVVVESASVRYERERVDKWIKDRLLNWPLGVCVRCRRPFVAGESWQELSNSAEVQARARFHQQPCYAEWRQERELEARAALGLEN